MPPNRGNRKENGGRQALRGGGSRDLLPGESRESVLQDEKAVNSGDSFTL